jgi:hypothetical protein
MEILPPQFADESPARPVESADDLGAAALRGAAAAICKPFTPAELVEAFDVTGSLTFPIETFIS